MGECVCDLSMKNVCLWRTDKPNAMWLRCCGSQLPLSGSWETCDVYSNSSWTCHWQYVIWVAVFSLVVVPLSCVELHEQKAVQVCMSVLRFVALFLMIFLTMANIWADPYSQQENDSHVSQ